MAPGRSNTSRIIYVARTARELPGEVRDFLSQPGIRAMAVPNIYDALATLARPHHVAVLIVSIEAVDWHEMEFFDLLQRVSRDTQVFVAAHDYQQAKLEAALQRGAHPFNAEEIREALQASPHALRSRSLLAGTLQDKDKKAPASETERRSTLSIAPPRSSAKRTDPPEVERFRYEVEIPLTPAEPERPDAISPEPEPEPEQAPDAAPESDLPPAPPMRLVVTSETDNATESTVPFPWRPSSNRPSRIPPKGTKPIQSDDGNAQPSTGDAPGRAELTSEEIAALLGRQSTATSDAQEAQS